MAPGRNAHAATMVTKASEPTISKHRTSQPLAWPRPRILRVPRESYREESAAYDICKC